VTHDFHSRPFASTLRETSRRSETSRKNLYEAILWNRCRDYRFEGGSSVIFLVASSPALFSGSGNFLDGFVSGWLPFPFIASFVARLNTFPHPIGSFHKPWVPYTSHIHPRPHFHFPKQSISSSQGETRQSRKQYDCYEHIDIPSANLSRASKRRSSSRFHPPINDRWRRGIADRLNQRSA